MSGLEGGQPAMEGGGFYNRHSAMQAAGIALLSSLWRAACSAVTLSQPPLTIVDYGSSQGRNSMAPIRTAIEVLRSRAGTTVPIEVIHTDLPTNDFSALFQSLESDRNSYLSGVSGVYPSAIGRSFYEPLRPPESVHLGWSTWALQWMSRSPAHAPDHILAGMSSTAEVLAAVKRQQASDWRRFLEHRANEMRPGARLLVGFTARGRNETGWEWLLGELWSSVEDMGRDGLLSADEQRRLTIPIGLRSLAELEHPLQGAQRVPALVVEHIEVRQVNDLFWEDFQRTHDGPAFAQLHADTTRAWAGPTLASLIDPSRDRTGLVSELFTRFARRLAANPKKHEPYMAVVLLAKP
jgi:hypothetical protein